jgi:hypothetical protein
MGGGEVILIGDWTEELKAKLDKVKGSVLHIFEFEENFANSRDNTAYYRYDEFNNKFAYSIAYSNKNSFMGIGLSDEEKVIFKELCDEMEKRGLSLKFYVHEELYYDEDLPGNTHGYSSGSYVTCHSDETIIVKEGTFFSQLSDSYYVNYDKAIEEYEKDLKEFEESEEPEEDEDLDEDV